jgi:hypothetical protein
MKYCSRAASMFAAAVIMSRLLTSACAIRAWSRGSVKICL